jgi:hypothetical protein
MFACEFKGYKIYTVARALHLSVSNNENNSAKLPLRPIHLWKRNLGKIWPADNQDKIKKAGKRKQAFFFVSLHVRMRVFRFCGRKRKRRPTRLNGLASEDNAFVY